MDVTINRLAARAPLVAALLGTLVLSGGCFDEPRVSYADKRTEVRVTVLLRGEPIEVDRLVYIPSIRYSDPLNSGAMFEGLSTGQPGEFRVPAVVIPFYRRERLYACRLKGGLVVIIGERKRLVEWEAILIDKPLRMDGTDPVAIELDPETPSPGLKYRVEVP